MAETESKIFLKVERILKKIETIRDRYKELKDIFIDTIFKRVIEVILQPINLQSIQSTKDNITNCLVASQDKIKDKIFDLLTRHKILKLNTEKVEEFEIDINPFANFTISGDLLNDLRRQYNEIVIKILNIGNSIRIYDYEIDKLDSLTQGKFVLFFKMKIKNIIP